MTYKKNWRQHVQGEPPLPPPTIVVRQSRGDTPTVRILPMYITQKWQIKRARYERQLTDKEAVEFARALFPGALCTVDNSRGILREYQACYSRKKVVRLPAERPSHGRRTGEDEAEETND